MRPVLQVSLLLVIAGGSLFAGLGNYLYASGQYEELAVALVLTSGVILLGGLQCWLVPRPEKRRRASSFETGWRVCGLTTLALFAAFSLLLLYLVFFHLHVNAPYRVSYDAIDSRSGDVVAGRLPNGMRYYVTHSDFRNEKFSLVLRVGAGRLDEEDAELGLAHLCEHMAAGGSAHHAGRHGVMQEWQALGATLHSHTSHRATLFSASNAPYSPGRLRRGMRLLRDLALQQRPTEAELETEKLVLAGEERVENNTAVLLQTRVVCNHFGHAGRVCRRFQFAPGAAEAVASHTVTDVRRFFDRWYHPEAMQLYVAGDFPLRKVQEIIEAEWGTARRETLGSAPRHAPVPVPRPDQGFAVLPTRGVEGIQLSLLASTAYDRQVRTSNWHRHKMLNTILRGLLLNDYLARMIEFDYTRDELDQNVDLIATVEDSFELGRTLHSLELRVLGHPERGAWRRYVKILFVELRRLAELGPNRSLMERLMTTGRVVADARRAFSAYADSAGLARDMLGNLDPDFLYLDLSQQYDTHAQFLNRGFLDTAALHVQTEAQFMWRALAGALGVTLPAVARPPYRDLVPDTRSLTVFTDVAPGSRTGGSYVHRDEVRSLLVAAGDAVLLPPDGSEPTVVHLEDVFVGASDSGRRWDAGTGLSAGGDDEQSRRVHEHVRQLMAGAQGGGGAGGAGGDVLDGLPSTGSLVDPGRLLFDRLRPHDESVRNAPPPDPAVSDGDLQRRRREYELSEAFPETGVKRYRLSNGLRVNVKARLSGRDSLPSDAPGIVEMEIVSLGGRASQPPGLKGACELVDLDAQSGYTVEYWLPAGNNRPSAATEQVFFDSHTVDGYLSRVGRPRVRCGHEHFSVHQRLHSKCVNFPELRGCDPKHTGYLKKLEGFRLAMSPVYDANGIERGAKQLENLLTAAERRSDPDEFMKWRTFWDLQRPWMTSHNAEDPRSETVTPADIRRLDPEKVGLWVREQFTVDRMEVNVAGNFDEHHLLHQLNRMLGTMPLARNHDGAGGTPDRAASPRAAARVGYDVYDPAQEERFRLGLEERRVSPAVATRVTNCTMPSLQPGRAYVAMSVLTSADATSVRGHQRSLMASALLQEALLESLRRDHGFVWRVESEPFASQIFRRFGYWHIRFVVGLDRESDSAGREQIMRSVEEVRRILLSPAPFSEATFARVKAATHSALAGSLQDSRSWLPIMQGVSLRPPVWERTGGSFAYHYVKDVAQTDMLGLVESVTLEQVTSWFTQHMSSGHSLHVGVVETTEAGGNSTSLLGGGQCDWLTSSS